MGVGTPARRERVVRHSALSAVYSVVLDHTRLSARSSFQSLETVTIDDSFILLSVHARPL
jgi:hypothetical protein